MGTVAKTRAEKKRKKVAKIIEGKKREKLISQLFDIMEDWRLSHFEHEGTARAAIRSALCLNGHAWQMSDDEADSLVQAALKKMGAVRPSWYDGQPERTLGKDRCQSYLCGAVLSEDDIAAGAKFCSSSCGEFVAVHRQGIARRHEREVYVSGWYQTWKIVAASERKCESVACGKVYRSPWQQQKFCSPACAADAQRNQLRRRTCERPGCEEVFVDHQSAGRRQRYCSISCKEAGRPMVKLNCLECNTPFEARKTTGRATPRYCSDDCRKLFNKTVHIAKRKADRRIAAGKIPDLNAAIFDWHFARAA